MKKLDIQRFVPGASNNVPILYRVIHNVSKPISACPHDRTRTHRHTHTHTHIYTDHVYRNIKQIFLILKPKIRSYFGRMPRCRSKRVQITQTLSLSLYIYIIYIYIYILHAYVEYLIFFVFNEQFKITTVNKVD